MYEISLLGDRNELMSEQSGYTTILCPFTGSFNGPYLAANPAITPATFSIQPILASKTYVHCCTQMLLNPPIHNLNGLLSEEEFLKRAVALHDAINMDDSAFHIEHEVQRLCSQWTSLDATSTSGIVWNVKAVHQAVTGHYNDNLENCEEICHVHCPCTNDCRDIFTICCVQQEVKITYTLTINIYSENRNTVQNTDSIYPPEPLPVHVPQEAPPPYAEALRSPQVFDA